MPNFRDGDLPMRRVIVESPYGNPDKAVVAANVEYARRCIRDSLARGEAPIASHLLYTQPGILDDDVTDERARGINAGLAWGAVADATVVYLDRGVSKGMRKGIGRAVIDGRTIELRTIDGDPSCSTEIRGRGITMPDELIWRMSDERLLSEWSHLDRLARIGSIDTLSFARLQACKHELFRRGIAD